MSEYKHTQIGHVIIWSLLVVAVLGAIKATFELGPHRELLLVGIVLLITLALFYKLTITIDDEFCARRWVLELSRRDADIAHRRMRTRSHSLVVRLGNSSDAVRLALQRFRLGRCGDQVA